MLTGAKFFEKIVLSNFSAENLCYYANICWYYLVWNLKKKRNILPVLLNIFVFQILVYVVRFSQGLLYYQHLLIWLLCDLKNTFDESFLSSKYWFIYRDFSWVYVIIRCWDQVVFVTLLQTSVSRQNGITWVPIYSTRATDCPGWNFVVIYVCIVGSP